MIGIEKCLVPQGSPHAMDMEAEAIAEQHARGRLTARERMEILFDRGSFVELEGDDSRKPDPASLAEGDGVVMGYGSVEGRVVFAYAKDMTVLKGTMAGEHGRKIAAIQQLALNAGAPLVALHDSSGTRLDQADAAYAAFGQQYRLAAAARGVIPQIAVILGACIGTDALLAATADFVFMAGADSAMVMGDSDMARIVAGEDVSAADMGGAEIHAATTGLAHAVFDNDIVALRQTRRLLSFLPAGAGTASGWRSFDNPLRAEPSLDFLIPSDTTQPFDVKEVVEKVVDEGDFFELQASFAGNAVLGFARVDGRTVGVVANQPAVLAGVLNAAAARKVARFVGQCDALGVPLLSFVDAGGFVPGRAEEHAGIVGHAASLMCAYARAKVPLVTVVLRKAHGAAGLAMGSGFVCADVTFGWPQASVGMMRAQDATASDGDVQGDAACKPQAVPAGGAGACTSREPLRSGGAGAIISPAQTRRYIAQALSGGGKARTANTSLERTPS
ncbi:Propionyl-CoA carboxylase beta chain [compost metagenome]